METLPPEMVEMVARRLTPQDLASCCAVSHSWRDIFNQDWLWRSRCDPTLEEPLRTTPCVVEPVFDVPRDEDSALAPVCQWRLAYMREQHLWGNWKQGRYKREEIKFDIEFEEECLKSLLSDIHLMICCTSKIEIWDISVAPPTLVAKLHNPIEDKYSVDLVTVCHNMLIFKEKSSVKVYFVDVKNKCITLKGDIHVNEATQTIYDKIIVKEQICNDGTTNFFGIRCTQSNLIIFDFEKSLKLVKNCPIPEQGNIEIYKVHSSLLSDDVLVILYNGDEFVYYMYSLKQQQFLPGPIHKIPAYSGCGKVGLNKQFVAISNSLSLSIINYETREVLFKINLNNDVDPKEYKDGFIFIDQYETFGYIRMFSLKNKTISTILEFGTNFEEATYILQIVNNHVVSLSYIDDSIATFYLGQSLKEGTISVLVPACVEEINCSFTRGFQTDDDLEGYQLINELSIIYYW